MPEEHAPPAGPKDLRKLVVSVQVGGHLIPCERPADFETFNLLLGLRVVRSPSWDPDILRRHLMALLEWTNAQPEAGPTNPRAMFRWGYPWPTVPTSHPMHELVRGIRNYVQDALLLVDQGALDNAGQIYRSVTRLMEFLSARLAEPHADRGMKTLRASAEGGLKRAERSAPFKTEALAEAERRWSNAPNLSIAQMIRLISRGLTSDDGNWRPTERAIREWIAPLKPSRKSFA